MPILRSFLLFAGLAALAFAQQTQPTPAPAPPASPVAKQPKISSQKELEAVQAIMNALDPASRIDAANKLVTDFPKSDFRAFALQLATITYQQMNDYENMMIYGDRTLEVDPENYMVMLAMANGLAQRTREFDLDKEEKLGRSSSLATKALQILETAPRPNPNITDEQWNSAKDDFRAQGHEALGLVAMVRKDYDAAAKEFKQSIDLATEGNSATKVRLAVAYNFLGNFGEAITTLDAVLAEADLNPTIRQIAQAERARAVKLQDAKK